MPRSAHSSHTRDKSERRRGRLPPYLPLLFKYTLPPFPLLLAKAHPLKSILQSIATYSESPPTPSQQVMLGSQLGNLSSTPALGFPRLRFFRYRRLR